MLHFRRSFKVSLRAADPRIFQFCGQPRTLFVDPAAEDQEVPATAWRPWNLHMGLPGMVPDEGHLEAFESDEDPAWGPPRRELFRAHAVGGPKCFVQ